MTIEDYRTGAVFAMLSEATRIDDHFAESYIVTPDLAMSLLEGNVRNRAINQSRVEALMKTIMNGEWVYNAQPIVLSKDGTLLNGQHRLTAIVRTGLSVELLIAFNCNDLTAQDTIDTNQKRSLSQQLSIRGEKNTNNLAGALILVWELLNTGEVHASTPVISNVEAIRLLNEHPGIRESVKIGMRVAAAPVRFPPTMGAALHYLFSLIDEQDAATFFDVLLSGRGAASDQIIVVFREQMMTHALRPKTVTAMNKRVRGALTIKAWNAWRAGENRKLVSYKPTKEPFPDWMESMTSGL